jgi:hypothetical protein
LSRTVSIPSTPVPIAPIPNAIMIMLAAIPPYAKSFFMATPFAPLFITRSLRATASPAIRDQPPTACGHPATCGWRTVTAKRR